MKHKPKSKPCGSLRPQRAYRTGTLRPNLKKGAPSQGKFDTRLPDLAGAVVLDGGQIYSVGAWQQEDGTLSLRFQPISCPGDMEKLWHEIALDAIKIANELLPPDFK